MPEFDLKDHDQIARHLQDSTKEAVARGLLSAAYRLLGIVQNEIIPAEKPPPVAEGAYRAAWRVEPVAGGAHLVNDMPYAAVIEGGARAANIKIGRKMIDALAEWARLKGLTGHAPGARSGADAHAAARQIAWAIARAAQGTAKKPGKGFFNREGSQGLGIARKAVKRAAEFVEEEILREIGKGH